MAVILIFIGGFAAAEVVSYTGKSATWDEPMHLTAGYLALARGDYRADPSHPPFLRMWAALPLLAMPAPRAPRFRLEDKTVDAWLDGGAYDYARRFLYEWNDGDRLLYRARFMTVLWGATLGLLLFSWIRAWLGLAAASVGLVLYTLSPNLMAHASLVTTDTGQTCFIFGAVYFLWRATRHVTITNVAALAMCAALAVVSKFSGLVILPILAALLVTAVFSRPGLSPRAAIGISALLGATVLCAIWAVYGFTYMPGPDGSPFRLQDSDLVERSATTDAIA